MTPTIRRVGRGWVAGAWGSSLLVMGLGGWAQDVQAQTDAYIIEVVAEEAPGIVAEDTVAEERSIPQSVTLQMPGGAQVGPSFRRSDRNTGANTMLRYEQHRALSLPQDATLRIGPFYSNLGLTLSAGYRYTRFSGQGQDFLEGNRRGDVNEGGSECPLTVRAGFENYLILTRRMDLALNLQASYFYYPLGTQEDEFYLDLTDEGIFATFSTQVQPGRNSRIFVYDDILYQTDYIDTRGFSDRLGGREYALLQNTLGADWDWKASQLDTVSASASRSDTLPQSSEFEQQRAVRYQEMGMYRRQFNRFSTAGLVLNASQSLAQTDERPDSSIYGYHAFSGLKLTRNMDVEAAIGRQTSRVTGGDTDVSESQDSIYASMAVQHDLPGSRSHRLSAQRSVREAFDGGVDLTDELTYRLQWGGLWLPGSFDTRYLLIDPQEQERSSYDDWSSTLSVQTQLTRQIPLRFQATYAMRFNDAETVRSTTEGGRDAQPADDPGHSNDYQTLSVSLNTGFRLTERLRCSAYVQHARRTSDNPELAFERDTLGVTITWGYAF